MHWRQRGFTLSINIKKVYICPVCGYTAVDEAPEKCPLCGLPKEKFVVFE